MDNAAIARIFDELAAMSLLLGENPFRARAFRRASQVIDTLPQPVSELWRRGTLTDLPGIGSGIAEKVEELLRDGVCREHEEMASKLPAGILELLRVEGVGPQTVKMLWKRMGVTDLDSLDAALREGKLVGAPGMGPVRLRSLAAAVERHRKRRGRLPLHQALSIAETWRDLLADAPGVQRIEVAGSLRRRKETIGDVDLLAAAEEPWPVMEAFLAGPGVARILAKGETKSSIATREGVQVDLRVLPPEDFGAALHYFTGSKTHNILLRQRALRRGRKVSEYGVFDEEGERLSGAEEEEIFAAVGLPWIPPELREGSGEIEAAEAGRLPSLLEERDLKGDLHLHSDASSDGRSSLEEIWLEGRRLGRAYLAITDHSRSRPLGLDARGLLDHAATIRGLDARLRGGPRLLAGVEVDILEDGSLDLPVEVLAELDWVVASIHSHFQAPVEVQTLRLLRAIRSGVVDAIGHPTGRKIGKRDPYPLDLEAVLTEARRFGVALELNGNPYRLDLGDGACRLAKREGVPIVVDSDAHMSTHLGGLRYGVWTARRGWLEAKDVLNTRSWEELAAWRRRHGRGRRWSHERRA